MNTLNKDLDSRITFENSSWNLNDLDNGGSITNSIYQDHEGRNFSESESSNDLVGTQKYSHLWVLCEDCYQLNYKRFLIAKMNICEHCGFHLKMGSTQRIELSVDQGTWNSMDENMVSLDPIGWDSEDESFEDNQNHDDNELDREQLDGDDQNSDERCYERFFEDNQNHDDTKLDREQLDRDNQNSDESCDEKFFEDNQNHDDSKLDREQLDGDDQNHDNTKLDREQLDEDDQNSDESCDERFCEVSDEDLILILKNEKPYVDRIDFYQKETGLKEAVQTGTGQIKGITVAIGFMEFQFLGGSMGSAVGEKINRLIQYAIKQSLPLIIVCASGGARMQEGSLSLMQMAKISSTLLDYKSNKKSFYTSILTSPTTGGVTASFGMLGEIVIAEPHAYIAFAGKRVIEETLKIIVPEGLQETDYLFDKGLFDPVVPRNLLKDVLSQLLKKLYAFLSLTSNENEIK